MYYISYNVITCRLEITVNPSNLQPLRKPVDLALNDLQKNIYLNLEGLKNNSIVYDTGRDHFHVYYSELAFSLNLESNLSIHLF